MREPRVNHAWTQPRCGNSARSGRCARTRAGSGNGAWIRGVRKQRVNSAGTGVCRFFGKWVEKSVRGVIDIREATPLGVDPPVLVGQWDRSRNGNDRKPLQSKHLRTHTAYTVLSQATVYEMDGGRPGWDSAGTRGDKVIHSPPLCPLLPHSNHCGRTVSHRGSRYELPLAPSPACSRSFHPSRC